MPPYDRAWEPGLLVNYLWKPDLLENLLRNTLLKLCSIHCD